MTATVHDLISARQRRGRNPLHFADDIEAVEFVTAELAEIRAEAEGELLIPAAPLDVRLAQVAAVVSAIGTCYQRERDER